MELQTQYQTFNSMLTEFLKLNQGYTVKGEAQRLSKELTIFAQRPSFLDIAIQLLTTQSAKKDKAIFVTSLIKDKFKFDFQLVQTEKLLYYYHQLCQLGHRLGCQYHTVYTNISLALAYIYIHISSRSDEDLNMFLAPFIPSDPKDYKFFNYYFKIVEMLVVEVENSRFVIDQENRQIAKNKLLQQQYAILRKLNENSPIAWQIPQIDNENIIQCFTQWVCLGYNYEVLNSLPQHFLMNKMFEYVRDENHTKQTAESLRILVKYIGKPQDLPVLFQYLGTKMIQLLSVIDYFCENVEFTEAEDFFEIVAEFSRKSIPSFVRNFDDRIYDFLSKLCLYTQNELVNVFETCLQFWQQFLQQINKQKGVITPNPKIFLLMQEVYSSVCKRCKYPLKVIIQLDKIPQNKLYDHNYSAQEIFNKREGTDVFFKQLGEFIGQPNFIKLAYNKIQSISQNADDKLWPNLEVYLFSIVEPLRKIKVLPSEINDIVGIYLELQKKQNFVLPIILRKTFLKIFKSLMGAQHTDVNFVKLIFSLTAGCFNEPMLFSYAQRTFEKGCQLNAQIMKENLGEMVALIQQYPGNDHIVKGIMYLLCHSSQAAIQYLPTVLTFLFQKIQTAINPVVQKHLMHSLIGVVKVLHEEVPESQIYKGILVAFIRAIFPFVLKSLKQPKLIENDEDPEVQRMVKFLKLSMRYLKFEFTEFIDPLYTCVLQTFTQYPLCSYAYLIEIAITVYYDDPRYTDYFKAVYVKFCGILYDHMKQMENMEKYCYLLDDFIGMSKRFFVCNASIILSSGELPHLIDLCTTAFIGCDTPRIARASYSFFQTIFMVYWRKQFIDRYNSSDEQRQKFSIKESDQPLYDQLKLLLLEKLQFILSRIFQHLMQIPNQSTRQYIIQCFLSEIKAFPQQNMIIWPKLLQRLPANVLVANQKTRMAANLQFMMSPDFKVVLQTSRFMKKYIFLMAKRLVNANNRRIGF